MNTNINRKEIPHLVLFWLYVLSYLVILIKFSMSSSQSKFRYYILLGCIVFEIVSTIKKYGLNFLKKTKYNDLLYILLIGIVFFARSLFLVYSANTKLYFRTYIQIFLMVSPAVYSFFLLNNISKHSIIKSLKMLLFISIILYFIESGHTLSDFLVLSNYSTLFSNYSFTESSLFSDVFLQLFLLFNYFCFISKDKKNRINKSYVFLSAFFTILCCKRLATLIVIIFPFINKYVKNRNEILISSKKSKYQAVLLSLIFVILSIVYFKILNHELFQNFDIYNFSTGRDYILSLWKNYNYLSYGYGSSQILIGRYLEMDLVQIYLELGSIFLFLFSYYHILISNKKKYGLIVMTYCMLNMLAASSLPFTLGWIITFLTIKMIESEEVGEKYE